MDMTLLRLVPIHVHAALETLLAPAMIAAPFAFGFGPGPMIASFVLGVLLMGTALATGASLGHGAVGDARMRVSAHASVDLGLTLAAAASAVTFGFGGEPVAGLFFGIVAILHGALATTTRYATLPA
jgi:hypothetical protein